MKVRVSTCSHPRQLYSEKHLIETECSRHIENVYDTLKSIQQSRYTVISSVALEQGCVIRNKCPFAWMKIAPELQTSDVDFERFGHLSHKQAALT